MTKWIIIFYYITNIQISIGNIDMRGYYGGENKGNWLLFKIIEEEVG